MSKGSEPAFPTEVGAVYNNSGYKPVDGVISGGLTKRELFAAMALVGTLFRVPPDVRALAETIAMDAVGLADALLAELEREP